MEIADLHSAWSKETAIRFLDERIIPALSRSGLASPGQATTTLVRFATRSALFRHDWNGRRYAVKVWGPSTPPSHTVEAAFEWLQRLNRHDPAQTGLRFARPVAILPAMGTVVMDWIDAPNVRDVIARDDGPRRLAAVVASFQWLDRLHRLEPAVDGRLNWQFCVTVPLNALRRHAALIPEADRPIVDRVAARLVPLAKELRKDACEFRLLHFDASCANFLYDGTRAIGIDLHDTRFEDPMHDYCKLLVEADVLMNDGAALQPPLALGHDLQRLLIEAPLLQGAPRMFERVRLHLMSTALTYYGRRLVSQNPRVLRERDRHLAIADAVASDSFVAAAA